MPEKKEHISVAVLAEALFDELDRDSWGAIDPWLFQAISSINTEDDMTDDEQRLYQVLERTIKKLGLTSDKVGFAKTK